MESVRALLNWFAGGEQNYMTLYHCMAGDTFWIVLTIVLDAAVAMGYALIAWHWWRNQKNLQNQDARRALGYMRNIFIFCGICGYVFIPIKMVWPAWRLYDIFLLALAWYTWRYAIGAQELRVVYRELNKSAVLADELEATRERTRQKNTFLNAISHDLRNPLSAVAIHASLLPDLSEKGDREGVSHAVDAIQNSVLNMRSLLDQFLELGKAEWAEARPTFEMHDIRDVLRRLVSAYQREAEAKGLEFEFRCPRSMRLPTDRRMFERVVGNLVKNAVRYTEHGRVTVTAEKHAGYWLVSVEDTGVGISAEDQRRIFDDFFQVKNNERNRDQGFGVGLAICRRLSDQLGGRIELESELGVGSRFRLVLPRATPGKPDGASPDATPPAGVAAG